MPLGRSMKNQVGLKLIGTHQTLMMSIYWEITYILINKNTETLIDASKAVGLEINIEKTIYSSSSIIRMQVGGWILLRWILER
jgi:hypothetical protein